MGLPPGGRPPPNANGGYRKSTDLPEGPYDIFIVPPHSSGSGFIYLPSLQCHRNSFLAGVAATLVGVAVYVWVVPLMKTWVSTVAQSGDTSVFLIVIVVGVASWAWGRSQIHLSGTPHRPHEVALGLLPLLLPLGEEEVREVHSTNRLPHQALIITPGEDPTIKTSIVSTQGEAMGMALTLVDNTTVARSPGASILEAIGIHKEKELRDLANPLHHLNLPHRPQSPPDPPPATPPKQPQNDTPKPKDTDWEKAREETKRKEDIRRKMEEFRKKREEEEKEKQRQREKEAREREFRERKEKREKERLAKEAEEKEAAEKAAKEKARQEAAARFAAAREAAAAKRAADKAAAEKLAAEKLAAEKLAEKLAAAKLMAEKLAAEKLAAEKLAAEKLAAEKRAESVKQAPSPKTPPRTPSPQKKPPPFPSARTELDDDAYSFRPYDRPKKQPSAPSVFSESSYAPSQSTARTTPPPSRRGPYSTKDPDKIIISGVYVFNNTFMRTPVGQLVSGKGHVTDGLILRITTEGMFVDDDIRGVAQREWDIKAWTMKLVEVWCPQLGTNPPPTRPSPVKANPFRFSTSYAHKVPSSEESDAYLANLHRSCKNQCRLGATSSGMGPLNGNSKSRIIDDGDLLQSAELRGFHVVRASLRDQEGKKYVFVLQETEAWKVAIGLQRLKKGSQVRALGVCGLPANETNAVLESLGYIAN
ncbi:trans-sialidase [Blastomyces dermatitidis ATCC 18188]|uniref:Trans-sialidase n=1 Tax=Ajellomyces dermatitidis (strain ATCC 18188 / CBS 674.68) TaxID=653446 RepID=F2TA71_AJEDA|nr:trans-sialidase [Blastomyces dermatitidis ATCC 18188]